MYLGGEKVPGCVVGGMSGVTTTSTNVTAGNFAERQDQSYLDSQVMDLVN